MFNVNTKIEDGKAVIAVEGRLDTVTPPEAEQAVKAALPEITELVLDFSKLEYVSSAGLRVILSAHRAMSARGEMKLTGVSDAVMEIFEVTGFSDILTIE